MYIASLNVTNRSFRLYIHTYAHTRTHNTRKWRMVWSGLLVICHATEIGGALQNVLCRILGSHRFWDVTSCGLVEVHRYSRGPSYSIPRAYTSTLMMEAIRSFVTSVDFCRTTRHYIPEYNTVQKRFLQSVKVLIFYLESVVCFV
jgi:hypothetical protein